MRPGSASIRTMAVIMGMPFGRCEVLHHAALWLRSSGVVRVVRVVRVAAWSAADRPVGLGTAHRACPARTDLHQADVGLLEPAQHQIGLLRMRTRGGEAGCG